MSRIIAVLAISLAVDGAVAQPFDSGSNGSAGAIVVTSGQTLNYPVPADGKIHATTVSVATSGILRFVCNAKNTPVYLLATSDVTVNSSSSTISVSPTGVASGLQGQPGGCGGFAGGEPNISGEPAGDGYGPGGGKGAVPPALLIPGNASYGTESTATPAGQQGSVYGTNLLVPLVGGSGGGGRAGVGGGGGGGALLIASSSRILMNGQILAEGGNPSGNTQGNGSGGAIRLVAPRIEGSGILRVDGGHSTAGRGRIRLDMQDRSGFNISGMTSGIYSVGTLMQSFPQAPELDFTLIAGTVIADGSGPVDISLDPGASPSQTLTLRARNFTGTALVRVVLTPPSGPRMVLDDSIDMAGGSDASKVIPFTVQPGVLYRVQAWSR